MVPNIGTESINAQQVGVQWQVLEEIDKRGIGPRLIVHGFSSIKALEVEQQRRLGHLGVVGMNAWSYIPQHIGPQLLERSAKILSNHDEKLRYPVDFDDEGQPVYSESDDANVFFGPVLDQVRDLKVSLIADSVYEILGNLGYAAFGADAS